MFSFTCWLVVAVSRDHNLNAVLQCITLIRSMDFQQSNIHFILSLWIVVENIDGKCSWCVSGASHGFKVGKSDYAAVINQVNYSKLNNFFKI